MDNSEVFKVEIENLKEDIKEMKEDRKVMMETQQSMSNSLVRLTTLMEKNDERLEQQDKKIDEHHVSINGQIEGLRSDMSKERETNIKWYQTFMDNNFGKVVKVLIIVVLLMTGMKLAGADISHLIKGL
ncbi:hypothetical protein [uncultured Metabacillus sp.]|uniref:hypothetical protein n=1 Tax=uncultured Metabacillus sp. TaxID=2860135 RepID=UPI002603BE1F|nr:hypothetical protein [uncultured Metabacillus sp.]